MRMELLDDAVSLHQLCNWVLPDFPSELITTKYKEKLLDCAGLLSTTFGGNAIAFECPMMGEVGGDFHFQIRPPYSVLPFYQMASRAGGAWKNLLS